MEYLSLIISIAALVITFTSYKPAALLVIVLAVYLAVKDIKNKKNYKYAFGAIAVSVIAFVVVFSNGPTVGGNNSSTPVVATSVSKEIEKEEKKRKAEIGDTEKIECKVIENIPGVGTVVEVNNKNKIDVGIYSLKMTVRNKKTGELLDTKYESQTFTIPAKSSKKVLVNFNDQENKKLEYTFETTLGTTKNDKGNQMYVTSGLETSVKNDVERENVLVTVNNKSKLDAYGMTTAVFYYKDNKIVGYIMEANSSNIVVSSGDKVAYRVNYAKDTDGKKITDFDKCEAVIFRAYNVDSYLESASLYNLGYYEKGSDFEKLYKKLDFKKVAVLDNGDALVEITNNNSEDVFLFATGAIVKDKKFHEFISFESGIYTCIVIPAKSSVYNVFRHKNGKANGGTDIGYFEYDDESTFDIKFTGRLLDVEKEKTYQKYVASKINVSADKDNEAQNVAVSLENKSKYTIKEMEVLCIYYKGDEVVAYNTAKSKYNDILDPDGKTLFRTDYPVNKEYKKIEDFTRVETSLIHAIKEEK